LDGQGESARGRGGGDEGVSGAEAAAPSSPPPPLDGAQVWDAETGSELLSIDHPHVVKCVAATRDDRLLATGCNDRKLRLFSLTPSTTPDGSPAVSHALVAALEHPKAVRKVVLSPDDAVITTGCEDGVVRAWSVAALVAAAAAGGSVASVPPVAEFNTSAAGGVMDLEVSANGLTVTVGAGKSVWVLHARDLSVACQQAVPFDVSCASLHPGGRMVVAAGSDVSVHVYRLPEVAPGEAAAAWTEVARLKGHHGIIHCVRWSPDGKAFLSGADDAIIRLWGTDTVVAPLK